MTDKPFYQTEKSLWKAKGYYSPETGELVCMTNSDKIVYMYMLDRVTFFVEELKTLHFESQETISESLNLERKVVGKALRGFLEHGVLKGEKRKPDKGGQLQWFYSAVCKDMKYFVQDGKPVSEEKVVKSTKQRKPYIPPLGEDADCPF